MHVDYTKYYQFDEKKIKMKKNRNLFWNVFLKQFVEEIPEKNSAYEIDFVKWKEINILEFPNHQL